MEVETVMLPDRSWQVKSELNKRLRMAGIDTSPTWNESWLRRIFGLKAEDREAEIIIAIRMLEKTIKNVNLRTNCRPFFLWDSMPMTTDLLQLKNEIDACRKSVV